MTELFPTCRHGRDAIDCPFCRTHTTNPATSHHAAHTGTPNISAKCAAVLQLLEVRPSTADELDDAFPEWPPRTAARRLSDLKRIGLIEETGERRPTRYGSLADVYAPITTRDQWHQ